MNYCREGSIELTLKKEYATLGLEFTFVSVLPAEIAQCGLLSRIYDLSFLVVYVRYLTMHIAKIFLDEWVYSQYSLQVRRELELCFVR